MRYPKAPIGARLLASLIDALIAGLPFLAVVLGAVVALLPLRGVPTNDLGARGLLALVVGGLLALAAGLWALWYTHVKDGMPGGQSWGKRWTGLMVVHLPTNAPCSRWQSAIRKLVWAGLMAIPVVGWLVEPLAALLREGGRRVGDQVADTQVVERSAYRRALAEQRADGALGAGSVDPYEAALLRDAMREVDEITRRPG